MSKKKSNAQKWKTDEGNLEVENADEDVTELKSLVVSLQSEISELRGAKVVQDEIQRLGSAMVSLESQLASEKSANASLKRRLDATETDMPVSRLITDLQQCIATFEADIVVIRKENQRHIITISDLHQRLSTTESDLSASRAENQQHTATIAELRLRLAASDSDLLTIRTEVLQHITTTVDLRQRLAANTDRGTVSD